MQKLNGESKSIVEENISVADDAHWRGTNQGSQLAGNAALWDNGDLENDPEFGSSDFNTHPGGLRSSDNGLFTRIGYQGYLWLANISYEYEYTWNRKLDLQ